jgi:hypothetical protein
MLAVYIGPSILDGDGFAKRLPMTLRFMLFGHAI